MPTHALYIDDSGTKEYAEDPAEYEGRRGNSRHFLFCGVLASVKAASDLAANIIELKNENFGTPEVEIKSTWLRNPETRSKKYLNPYAINDEQLTCFVDDYYDLIRAADVKLIAAIIDKKEMQEHYQRPFYPPATAYEMLLCRVQSDLANTDSVAVLIDDTTGKTPKGSDYKTLLDIQHKALKQNGSKLWKGFTFPSLGSQRFVNSAISHLVQVADVCAYCVYRQFIDHGDDWERPGIDGKLPMYPHFERIHTKFRCNADGVVQGYGLIKLPQKNQMRWSIDRP